jgi:hypothetical protein
MAYGKTSKAKTMPAKKSTTKVAQTCKACKSPAKCGRAGMCMATGKKLRMA